MKRRTRRTLNFFAFNILFFAIYLNFIQKNKPAEPTLLQSNSVIKNSQSTLVSAAPDETKIETEKGAIN